MQREQDEAGILRSREVITKFITDELDAGIPSNRIILGGFSQGGAMALITGTTIPHTLAGIFGLSTYLVMANKIKELAQEAKDANKNTPFFMAHGDADQVLNIEFGRLTAERLRKELGHQVEWHEYRYGLYMLRTLTVLIWSCLVVCLIRQMSKRLMIWKRSSQGVLIRPAQLRYDIKDSINHETVWWSVFQYQVKKSIR